MSALRGCVAYTLSARDVMHVHTGPDHRDSPQAALRPLPHLVHAFIQSEGAHMNWLAAGKSLFSVSLMVFETLRQSPSQNEMCVYFFVVVCSSSNERYNVPTWLDQVSLMRGHGCVTGHECVRKQIGKHASNKRMAYLNISQWRMRCAFSCSTASNQRQAHT